MSHSLAKLYFLFYTMMPETGTFVLTLAVSFKNSPFLLLFNCFYFALELCIPNFKSEQIFLSQI